MIVALIDNGSLEPAAHRNLRAVAAALSERSGTAVHAVSWKHSDRVSAEALDGVRARTLARFVREHVARGEREFVFVPFFISPQGAIGSALRRDLEGFQTELGALEFSFTAGLAERGALRDIVVARVREMLATRADLFRAPPPVVIVDHGGPSATSAALRDETAAHVRAQLGSTISELTAASMEGEYGPLLADVLNTPAFANRDVLVAPLFLTPGRHAGPEGDIARICRGSPARCFLTDLIGTHPLALDALSDALRDTLSNLHAETFA